MAQDCSKCETELRKTDLDTTKMSHLCPECAPEFVKAAAFDDYDGPYTR